MSNALKIIEALGRHEDAEAISVLRDLGTNSPRDDVREETAKALIRRNSEESLRIVVSNQGKGINDLNAKVALSTVSSLLELQDKTELMTILNETIDGDNEETIKETARSLRALINLSE